MSTLASGLPRAFFVLVCLFALVRSVRMGIADSLARPGQPEQIVRAIAMEPRNSLWESRLAVLRYQSGDVSPETVHDLESLSIRRPYDAEPLMALGLLMEQSGDFLKAEGYLQQAVRVDRRFKPAWTLANFYYRTGNIEKMRDPLVACLNLIEPKNLEPWSFDPAPIFNLAWLGWSNNPAYIASLIPKRHETLLPFLVYLTTNHAEVSLVESVALRVWPDVIKLAEPSDGSVLLGLIDHLLRFGTGYGAIRIWNDLVDKNFVPGARVHPEQGRNFADPAFEIATFEHGFGWKIPYSEGVNSTLSPGLLTIEFSAAAPEKADLLSTYAAVLPGRKYRLRWLLTGLSSPGIRTLITDGELKLVDESADRDVALDVPANVSRIGVDLHYERPTGQARLRGSLLLKGVRLELMN